MQQNSPDNSAEIYDAFAEQYRSYSDHKSAYIHAVDQVILSQLQGKASRIMDYGAADGVRGAALAHDLESTFLCQADISDQMLEKCRTLGKADLLLDCKQANWENNAGQYDCIMSLWNVLGHIPTTQARIKSLRKLRKCLNDTGVICFDVNNRHYAGYGKYRTFIRRVIDVLYPNFNRGDTSFDWMIDGKSYPANGHLFTLYEVKYLLKEAGLTLINWQTIDYKTGKSGHKTSDGQLLFFAKASHV
jgi:hypothetical protein